MKPLHLIFVTGLAGSGKSTAAHALEDLQFWCVDNLPLALLGKLLRLTAAAGGQIDRLAVVCDARDPDLANQLPAILQDMEKQGHHFEVVFFEASDQRIVERYAKTKRRHPLASSGSAVEEAVVRERELLSPLRALSTRIIDTSDLTVHELKRLMVERFGENNEATLEIGLLRFSYQRGLPAGVDLVFDARCLPAADHDHPGSQVVAPYIDGCLQMLTFLYPLYQREGKSYLTVGVGCGHNQVVAASLVGELHRQLESLGISARIRQES